ncbi:MAG: DUF922 domain-containing protein [Flavobacteriales bacterium]|nr:DUF922 domain-containing protein [Flavobacteriales bacterium]
MRILLFCSLISFSFFLHAQKARKERAWQSIGQLNWNDYKAKPNKATSFKALTSTGVTFAINYEGDLLSIEVSNFFHPNSSWTKNNQSEKLLRHERLHFDISELLTRKLRKEISKTNFKTRGKKLMSEISTMYQEKMKELSHYQKRYDKETDHSIIEEAQRKWEIKVKRELKSLQQYSSSEVKIELED